MEDLLNGYFLQVLTFVCINIILAMTIYMTLCTGIWLAQLTLALLACVRDIRRSDPASGAKAGSLRYMTLYVAFFGAALFLMLWEARGRYLFGFVAVLLLLAAHGALRTEEGM